MVLTADHPAHRGLWRHSGQSSLVRIYHPITVAGLGFLAALLGAWAGIVGFVGPEFGYRPTSASSWQWTTANWLLHLVPGAVAFGAGLMVMATARATTASARGLLRIASLGIIASGAWLVIGPALWPVFESGAPYAAAGSAQTSFTNQIGANLGPGLLLVLLGGMILEAVRAGQPGAVRTEPAGDAAAEPVTAAPVSRPVADPAEVTEVRRSDAAAGPSTMAAPTEVGRSDEAVEPSPRAATDEPVGEAESPRDIPPPAP
jgi:hypothetical protein